MPNIIIYIFYGCLGAYLVTLMVISIIKKVSCRKNAKQDVLVYEESKSDTPKE